MCRRPMRRRSTPSSSATRLEGIIPALEPAHALAYVMKLAPKLPRDNLMVMNMCGRGDKDIFSVAEHLTWRCELATPHRQAICAN